MKAPTEELYDFAKWVASEIFDDDWEYNKDAFAEIACRKLAKLGIVRAKGDKWELVEPKWIPVSKRLPEKNVWVLVTVIQESGAYVEVMRLDKYKGMFTDDVDYYDSIIAWMPLPEPYKVESEDI